MLKKRHYPADATDTSYVDDVCMIQTSRSIARAITLLEDRSEQHLTNGASIGLTFSPDKSELLHCLPSSSKHKQISLSSRPPPRIRNRTIMPARHIKYLGVHIDESLSFTYHATMCGGFGQTDIREPPLPPPQVARDPPPHCIPPDDDNDPPGHALGFSRLVDWITALQQRTTPQPGGLPGCQATLAQLTS